MKKVFILLAAIFIAGTLLQSCNVTRTTITKSEFFQRGDTTIQIQTKTVESYDASKKGF